MYNSTLHLAPTRAASASTLPSTYLSSSSWVLSKSSRMLSPDVCCTQPTTSDRKANPSFSQHGWWQGRLRLRPQGQVRQRDPQVLRCIHEGTQQAHWYVFSFSATHRIPLVGPAPLITLDRAGPSLPYLSVCWVLHPRRRLQWFITRTCTYVTHRCRHGRSCGRHRRRWSRDRLPLWRIPSRAQPLGRRPHWKGRFVGR